MADVFGQAVHIDVERHSLARERFNFPDAAFLRNQLRTTLEDREVDADEDIEFSMDRLDLIGARRGRTAASFFVAVQAASMRTNLERRFAEDPRLQRWGQKHKPELHHVLQQDDQRMAAPQVPIWEFTPVAADCISAGTAMMDHRISTLARLFDVMEPDVANAVQALRRCHYWQTSSSNYAQFRGLTRNFETFFPHDFFGFQQKVWMRTLVHEMILLLARLLAQAAGGSPDLSFFSPAQFPGPGFRDLETQELVACAAGWALEALVLPGPLADEEVSISPFCCRLKPGRLGV